MGRATTNDEPENGFLDDEFARFRAERMRSRGKKATEKVAVPAEEAPAADPTEAPHLDGADDEFARFRAERMKAGGTGRLRAAKAAQEEAHLDPHVKAALPAVAAPVVVEAAPAIAAAPAALPLEPHVKTTLPDVEAAPPAPAAARGADDGGMFFGTSSQERRATGARVRESRSDLSVVDLDATLAEEPAADPEPARRAPPPPKPVRGPRPEPAAGAA